MAAPDDTQELISIYARAANGVIGKDGQLPWHIAADLKRFKALTLGKPIIMGRKTFESFARLLPGRRHIVLTRDPDWHRDGAEAVGTIDAALALVAGEQAWVIGGAEIYLAFMDHVSRVEVTQIHREYDGDTFMPPLGSEWEVAARVDVPEAGELPPYSLMTYTRVGLPDRAARES